MEEEDYSLKQGRRSPSRLAAGQDWPISSLLRPAAGLSLFKRVFYRAAGPPSLSNLSKYVE
jgi:hypothetical protein